MLFRSRCAILLLVLSVGPFACSSNDASPSLRPGGAAGPGGTGSGNGAPGSDGGAPAGGPLASIVLTPTTATVVAGAAKQFTLTAKDASGNPPFPFPSFTWSVSGGGTVGSTGLFAAVTAGGPYTVTVKGGGLSATATVMVTPAPLPTITMGETAILATDDSGNADLLLAQQATLDQAATIRSLSFYVLTAAGNLRLGLYDATGANGGPGAKKAETAEFAAQAGWNAVNVVTPVLLPKGSYWLAYAPSSSDLHFVLAGDGTGMIASFSSPYGPMPDNFDPAPNTTMDHWSFYATLNP